MKKSKSSETLSLVKPDQKKVANEIKNLKQKIQEGTVEERRKKKAVAQSGQVIMKKSKSSESLSLVKPDQKKIANEIKNVKQKIQDGTVQEGRKKITLAQPGQVIKKKLRSTETLSLVKTDQKKVANETKNLKKKIQEGTVLVREGRKTKPLAQAEQRGLIFISHLPHGFYENQIKSYFSQFGKVTNVKVCRSARTGKCKGFGYVEFAHPEVAKIAGETMNNYIMFKKKLIAEYVPFEKRPKHLFHGKSSTEKVFSTKVRREKQFEANNNVSEETQKKRNNRRLSRLNKKLQRLEKVDLSSALPKSLRLLQKKIVGLNTIKD